MHWNLEVTCEMREVLPESTGGLFQRDLRHEVRRNFPWSNNQIDGTVLRNPNIIEFFGPVQ